MRSSIDRDRCRRNRWVGLVFARLVRLWSARDAPAVSAAPGATSLSPLLLIALAAIVAGLLLLGVVSAFGHSRLAAIVSLPLCAVAAMLDLTFLVGRAMPATISVPAGLPGAHMLLTLDGLSGFFLLLLFVASSAAAAAATDHHDDEYGSTAPFFPVFIAGMALTLLAGDAFALLIGFELMSLASFALVLTRHDDEAVRRAALLYFGMAALGAACLIPAFGLLAHVDEARTGFAFTEIRAHPPEGWRAIVVFVLVLIGAGSKAGLAPLHLWLPPAHAAAPGHVSALMSGAMTKVALYVLIRTLFDLSGPATPLWWSMPLLLLGAGGAVLGGLRANTEGDLKAVLACSTIENVGLIAAGLGLALAARAADLPVLAALALGGALLHALAHGMFKSLLFIAAGAAQHGAGTRMLSRLGGLVHRMPVTTAAALVGGACLAGLPPTSGFAGEWTLFQAVLAAPRIGGVGLQTVVCVVALMMALAAALAAAAAVRMIGVGFLGRPRTPRAAAAEEAGPGGRTAMIALCALSLFIGLVPGLFLRLLEPASRMLVGLGMDDRATALVVSPQADTPGYSAVAIAVLLGLAIGVVIWMVRAHSVQGHRRGPAWDCGFGAPPAWFPLGDPLTQYGAASFSQPLRRALGGTLLAARETVDMPDPGDPRPAHIEVATDDPASAAIFRPVARWRDALSGIADGIQFLTVRQTLSIMFAAVVLFLAAVALTEQM